MNMTPGLQNLITSAEKIAESYNSGFLTLEHILLAMLEVDELRPVLTQKVCSQISPNLIPLINNIEKKGPNQSEIKITPEVSETIDKAAKVAEQEGRDPTTADLFEQIYRIEDSIAAILINDFCKDIQKLADIKENLLNVYPPHSNPSRPQKQNGQSINQNKKKAKNEDLPRGLSDLSEQAEQGKIDVVIGRDSEINEVITVLARRRKKNAILTGEAGVGKTAIAEGLALAIHNKTTPNALHTCRVYSIDLGDLVAGTRYRGDFEERLRNIIDFLEENKGSIAFIDEIHQLVGAGSTGGGDMDASNILKPALARGSIRCLGATTHQEFKKIEADKALLRRFQRIDVTEPSIEDSIKIITGLKGSYESHHSVTYDDESIRDAVVLSDRYMKSRQLPDKAIDIIDATGARVSMWNVSKVVTPEEIRKTISIMAHIPEQNLQDNEKTKVLTLDQEIRKVVFNQDQAIHDVVRAIKISRAGLNRENRPVGSFLFAGPTGVGKTELAKKIAESMSMKFLRFDMSEYMEQHSVSRLIGSPPGYVGHGEGGQLTDAVDKNQNCVILLDEIEKAHPRVLDLMLQVVDGGRLTDSVGKVVDFTHCILIMTSNLGSRAISEKKSIGFSSGVTSTKTENTVEKGEIMKAVEEELRPEFRNKIDKVIVFNRLSEESMIHIVEKNIAEMTKQITEKGYTITITDAAKQYFAKKGYDPNMGARPLAKLMDVELREPIAEAILSDSGTVIVIDLAEEKISIIVG